VTWRFKPMAIEQLLEEYKNLPLPERQKYRYLKGHIAYGIHEWVGRPAHYITLVRQPVEHVASIYYYSARRPNNPLYKVLHEEGISLEDFVTGPLFAPWANLQTRSLCGAAVTDALDPKLPVTPDMLEAAKANIRRDFACVGLTDRFDETMLLMQRIFGWRNVTYAHMRLTRDRPRGSAIPARTVELIAERTRFDAELYEFACRLFEEQLQAVGGISAEEIERYRRVNRVFGVVWTLVETPRQALMKRARSFRDRHFPGLRRRQSPATRP
jgi:hypothetical protein